MYLLKIAFAHFEQTKFPQNKDYLEGNEHTRSTERP